MDEEKPIEPVKEKITIKKSTILFFVMQLAFIIVIAWVGMNVILTDQAGQSCLKNMTLAKANRTYDNTSLTLNPNLPESTRHLLINNSSGIYANGSENVG